MSRRVYLLGVAVALVGLALGFTDWALSLRPGVTEANTRRVREGMTRAEVEAILGGPGTLWIPPHRPTPPSTTYFWTGPRGEAVIRFSASTGPGDFVKSVHFKRTEGTSRLARLRAWLGW